MPRTAWTTAVLVAAVLLAAAACGRDVERAQTTFSVEGMHCDSCSSSIVATLGKLDGVELVTADHEAGVAEALYRPEQVDAETLKAEIEKLGYTVTGMTTETVEG